MRRIQKSLGEPKALVEFRAGLGAEAGRDSWNDFPYKDAIRSALCEDQGNLCCYCPYAHEYRSTQLRQYPPRLSSRYPRYPPSRSDPQLSHPGFRKALSALTAAHPNTPRLRLGWPRTQALFFEQRMIWG